MSKLEAHPKKISELFTENNPTFCIPDYQRPYSWDEDKCRALWDDIQDFGLSVINSNKNKDGDEGSQYYLGSIVMFREKDSAPNAVIDGQQRLTTITLLLRAFYKELKELKENNVAYETTIKRMEECLYKTDRYHVVMENKFRIESKVAVEKDKKNFEDILKTGVASDKGKKKNDESNYNINYRLFVQKIQEFKKLNPSDFVELAVIILDKCILLSVIANSEDDAFRIFSTLNDRGLPLADADIFKAQFYKYFLGKDEQENFIKLWGKIEEKCKNIFYVSSGNPMDELFTRYMYYKRAQTPDGKSTTLKALRTFYAGSNGKYELLNEITFKELEILASFWEKVKNQDKTFFEDDVLNQLFILNYAPNGMWTYIVSVYYMSRKDEKGNLKLAEFAKFLKKIIAFIWMYTVTNPGVNSLRVPLFPAMAKLATTKEDITFADVKKNESFTAKDVKEVLGMFNDYAFSNSRPITKSMLAWWAFNNPNLNQPQNFIKLDKEFQIEHIYAASRVKNDDDNPLENSENVESLGNKVLFESTFNDKADNFGFISKKKQYMKSSIQELQDWANDQKQDNWKDKEIEGRKEAILENFGKFLKDNLPELFA